MLYPSSGFAFCTRLTLQLNYMSIKTGSSCNTASALATVLGSALVLVGLYASLRIGVNMVVFERYPTTGVLQIASFPIYGQREEDCDYSAPHYSYDGKPRDATEAEMKIEEIQMEGCLSAIKETRRVALIQDIGTASFFLFMGIGMFITKRFLAHA